MNYSNSQAQEDSYIESDDTNATKTTSVADNLETQVINSIINNADNSNKNSDGSIGSKIESNIESNNSIESKDNNVENTGENNEDLDKPATIIIPMLKDADQAIKDAKDKLSNS